MGLGEWVKRLFTPVNALDHMNLGARDDENALMVNNIYPAYVGFLQKLQHFSASFNSFNGT